MKFDDVLYLVARLDKNSKFLLSMIVLIIILLILIIIISYILKVKEKKALEQKRLEYKKEFKKNIKVINFEEDEKLDLSPTVSLTPLKKEEQVKKEVKKEEPIVKIEEPRKEIVQKIEPEVLEEEIEVIEVIEDETDEIEKIKESIKESQGVHTFDLNKWEQEQEDSAIISYDELVKRAGAKKIVYKTKKKTEKKNEFTNNVNKTKTFKPSEIISPVYGSHENIKKLDEEIDAFSKVEKLRTNNPEEEMDYDMEFLNKLKKFRSELGIK